MTALIHSAKDGWTEIVSQLVAAGANLNLIDKVFKMTALGHAKILQRHEIVAILEQAKTDH